MAGSGIDNHEGDHDAQPWARDLLSSCAGWAMD